MSGVAVDIDTLLPICKSYIEEVVLIPILPLELIKKKLEEPLVTLNDPDPKLTDAVTLPVAIWNVLKLAIDAT